MKDQTKMNEGIRKVNGKGEGGSGNGSKGKNEISARTNKNASLLSSVSALVKRLEFAASAGFNTHSGKRDIFATLGYPDIISIDDYRSRYRRGGIAKRIIDFFPREIWAGGFEIIDNDDPDIETEFELAVESISKRIPVIRQLKRADKLARFGHYSVILLGIADNKPLSEEIGQLSSPDQLVYMTPIAEDKAEILELVKDNKDSRFGLPLYYKLTLSSEKSSKSKLYIPPEKVHYSRIIHITTDPLEDDLNSIPQLEPIYNYLIDLDKTIGGGSEAAWNQAIQILHAKLDPEIDFDTDSVDALDEKMIEMLHKRRQMLITSGVDINALPSNVDKFSSNADTIADFIAGTQSIQKRILFGSERGELASSQDRQNKIDTISSMRGEYAEPTCIRQFYDRLIKYGALPKPENNKYSIIWVSEEKLSETDKALAAKARADANLAQVQAGGGLITTSDEIRDDIYNKEPLEVEDVDIEDIEEVEDVEEIIPTTPLDTPPAVSISASKPEIKNLHKVVDRNLSSFSNILTSYWSDLEITDEVLSNINNLDLQESEFIDTTSDKLLSVMAEASKPAAKVVKSRVQTRFSAISIKLDITNPRAIDFAKTRSSELVKEISAETKLGIQELIAQSIEDGIPVNKISQSIRSSIGLRSDQVQAVSNLKDELRAAEPGSLVTRFPGGNDIRDLPGLRIRVPKSGVTEEWINKKADKYAEMQLNYRSRLIARTELSRSANEGQRELWRQSIENGYLPEGVKRIWLANTDRHGDMDGQTTGIDESFDPPIEPGEEPNCGCSQGLLDSASKESDKDKSDTNPDNETETTLTPVSDTVDSIESEIKDIDNSGVIQAQSNLDEFISKEESAMQALRDLGETSGDEFNKLQQKAMLANSQTMLARTKLIKEENTIAEKAKQIIHSSVEVKDSNVKLTPSLTGDKSVNDGVNWLQSHMSKQVGNGEIEVNRINDSRSFFNPKTGEISLGYQSKTVSFMHEVGHKFESMDEALADKAREFLASRTVGEKPVQLSELLKGYGYSKDEMVLADKFFHPYVGKVYSDGSTEILSMGLEKFYSNPAELLAQDKELFKFVLEFLRGEW